MKQRLAHAHRRVASLKGAGKMGKGGGTRMELADGDDEEGSEEADDEHEEDISSAPFINQTEG